MTETYTRFDPMPKHRFIERELIRQLVAALHARGWIPFEFECDGDKELIEWSDDADRQELQDRTWHAFDQFDEGILWFRKDDDDRNWVKLIGGNSEDVISDYGNTPDFEAAISGVFLR